VEEVRGRVRGEDGDQLIIKAAHSHFILTKPSQIRLYVIITITIIVCGAGV
jgi:hypothetical protein